MLHCPEERKWITVLYWENLLPHWTQSRCMQRMGVISYSFKCLLRGTGLLRSDPSLLAWPRLHCTQWLYWFNHSWFCWQPGLTGLDTHLNSEIPLVEESVEAYSIWKGDRNTDSECCVRAITLKQHKPEGPRY